MSGYEKSSESSHLTFSEANCAGWHTRPLTAGEKNAAAQRQNIEPQSGNTPFSEWEPTDMVCPDTVPSIHRP
jgi:hypothetical protein